MTTEEQQTLRQFETRVRQLILKYKTLEQEAQELYAMIDERDKEIETLKKDNMQWQEKYKNLKIARMIEITSEETEGAQRRIAHLIREIDKCISMLNV